MWCCDVQESQTDLHLANSFSRCAFWAICRVVVSTSSPIKDRRVSDVDFEEIWNPCWGLVGLLFSLPFKKMGNVTTKHNDQINVPNVLKVFVEGAGGIRLECDTRLLLQLELLIHSRSPLWIFPDIRFVAFTGSNLCGKVRKNSLPLRELYQPQIFQQETVAPPKIKALEHDCRSTNNIWIQERLTISHRLLWCTGAVGAKSVPPPPTHKLREE
jgi:hypothetical protein